MRLEGYSNYEIYPETGKIWGYKKNKFVGKLNKYGYMVLEMYDDNGDKHWKMLHRIIWECVNGPIPDNMEINHIDEDKTNNVISNLSLVDHKTNINWGTRNLRSGMKNTNHPNKSKMVVALKNGKFQMCFPSTMEAQRKIGVDNGHISKTCNNKRKKAGGYQWKYLDDYLGDLLEQIQNEDMI